MTNTLAYYTVVKIDCHIFKDYSFGLDIEQFHVIGANTQKGFYYKTFYGGN